MTWSSRASPRRPREEKTRARDAKLKDKAENDQMMKLYREHVLGEKPVEGLVPLSAIAPAAPKLEKAEAVGFVRRPMSAGLRRPTTIFPILRERGLSRITISTSWSRAVKKCMRRSTENPSNL